MNDGHQDTRPVIITARMDPHAQKYLDVLREAYFPKEINYLSAHLTLFHKLPAEKLDEVKATIQSLKDQFPFTAEASSVYGLGRGVAVSVDSQQLFGARQIIATACKDWLSPQDRQGFKPHVTVQNKVTAEAAELLLAQMTKTFAPFQFQILGLDLWRYDGGPWAAVK